MKISLKQLCVRSGLLAAGLCAAACVPSGSTGNQEPTLAQQEANLSPSCPSPVMGWHNGPVLSNVVVVPVLWGSSVDPATASGIAGFYAATTNSQYLDWLNDYNTVGQGGSQTIGRGSLSPAGAVTITPTVTGSDCSLANAYLPATDRCLLDSDFTAELGRQIAAGHLPAPDANTLYSIHLPPHVRGISSGGGGPTCYSNCGYHGNGPNYAFAIIPDLNNSSCNTDGNSANAKCTFGLPDAFSRTTVVSSHELVEAITDPQYGRGWTNSGPNGLQGCSEISDLCDYDAAGYVGTLPGSNYLVQKNYSRTQNACLLIGVDGAQFVGLGGVPASMTSGTTATVSVTMKNMGNSVWRADNGHKLGSQAPQDNRNWNSSRVLLAAGESIAPGASKTFTFTITAPPVSTPTQVAFQWRMVHENVAWFGDFSAAGVSITVNPAPSNAHVSIAWIQTAEATWGPAGTLTAAGNATGGTGGVTLMFQDQTAGTGWQTAPYVAPPAADGTWSNTIGPAPIDKCHTYVAVASYSGATTMPFTYTGYPSPACTEAGRMIWIQPQSTAGFGPPGSLIVAGSASGAAASGGSAQTGAVMFYRDVSNGDPYTQSPYAPVPDGNNTWLNSIPNANPNHVYDVYFRYDAVTSAICRYAGRAAITRCP